MKQSGWLCLLALLVAGCERSPEPYRVPESREQTPVTNTAPSETVTPVPEVKTPSPAASTPASEAAYAQALAQKKEGKLAEARTLLQPIADGENPPDNVLELLSEINSMIIFSPLPAAEKTDYTIESGDSLGKIAKKFGTTIDLIKKSNNLKSDMIRLGDRLRVYQGKFAVRVNKSTNFLTVTDNGRFFKRYRVGTGEFSKTPVGTFQITDRIVHPPWYRGDKVIPYGDKENILGTHWLGLDIRGFGIHGTWDPNAIGKQATAGCVRLLNENVEELYVLLPTGTPVTIHE